MKTRNILLLIELTLLLPIHIQCRGNSGEGNENHAVCGNGRREYGEECDDGNTLPGDFCSPECKRYGATCGNNIVEGTEECDDGNLENGDCCDFTCFIEPECMANDGSSEPDVPVDVPKTDTAEITELIPETGELTDGKEVNLCIDRTCPEIECDLWEQTDCGFAEKCTLIGIDRICVPAGTSTEGQICDEESQCGVGLTCLSNGGSERLCYRFCRDDLDCFGTGSLCTYDILYDGEVIPGVKLCSRSCNPVSNIGCPTTFSCMIYQESSGRMRFLTDCAPHSGEGRDDEPCSSDGDCAAGLFCRMDEGRCTRYCKYPNGYCIVGTCHAFTPHVIIGDTEYGYCTQ